MRAASVFAIIKPFKRRPSTLGVRLGGGGRAAATTAAAVVPVFSTELIAFALTFPIVLATVAGLYPAWRASRMNAVAALKHE